MNRNNSRSEERKDDPPYSRIFVVCHKQLCEEDMLPRFEKFGKVETLHMPKDRDTGESKGIAYIKYNKTSSAALAIQELNRKVVDNDPKPMKVMIAASSKNESTDTSDTKRYCRVFLKVHKSITESELKDHFNQFGEVMSVHLQKDKATDECKGFAYINYKSFYDASKAIEECDPKYKAVFATPKEELKRSRHQMEPEHSQMGSYRTPNNYLSESNSSFTQRRNSYNITESKSERSHSVMVHCSPKVPQKYLEKLFNIIPGMLHCQYSHDSYNDCKAIVTYTNEDSISQAIKKINNFEFPSGETLIVKPNDYLIQAAENFTNVVNNFKSSMDAGNPDLIQLADAIAQASTLLKAATCNKVEASLDSNICSVSLPSPKPRNINGKLEKTCFIVCKPYPPPFKVLLDVFSCFGDLIDVSIVPNKNFGFAKYASAQSADQAIRTLNESSVCGVKLLVKEAEDRSNDNSDYKRIKLDNKHD